MFTRELVVVLCFFPGVVLAGQPGNPMPPEELAKFLGPVPSKGMTWTKVQGVDFAVYYGKPDPPLTGHVGFYVGGWPDFEPDSGSVIIEGRLGIFPLKWYRKATGEGKVSQAALVKLDHYWRADVWVGADRQADVDQLVAILGQLPRFTKKPSPEDGGPTVCDYYGGAVILVVAFSTFLMILTVGGWVLHRQLRKAQASLPRRLFLLAGYVGGMIAFIAVVAFSSYWLLRDGRWFDVGLGVSRAAAGVILIGGFFCIVFLVWGTVVLIRTRGRQPGRRICSP